MDTGSVPAQQSANAPSGDAKIGDVPAIVRFASATEEISPTATATAPLQHEDSSFNDVAADQIKALTKSLQGKPLQEKRMNTFQFEAFSLPPSRVGFHIVDTTLEGLSSDICITQGPFPRG